MKKIDRIFTAILILFAVVSFLSSCKKDEGPEYGYLVSNDFVVTYKADYINSLIDLASGEYPELADLKPYLTHDVDVYKVIYKTELDNKTINASGLLCVPVGGGEYPVICFQNGTNTVNDYAPSEYVHNPAYQFVEIMASMGYAVVIPDYPGFGESAHMAHPYLIREPTVRSIVDMLFAVREADSGELTGLSIKNEYFLMGYSQGGWATLSLHKALEKEYYGDFTLKGSVCGAGPYDLNLLFSAMSGVESYPMPVYIGYIVNAYSFYDQFTNPVSDILKEPYASRLSDLYDGTMTSDQINNQLTTSISDLFTEEFLSGFESGAKYSSVRAALTENSIEAWNTSVPLFLIHGGGDTSVDPMTTDNIYRDMIDAGTSSDICTKEIIPGLDHGDAVIPAMIKGLSFILGF